MLKWIGRLISRWGDRHLAKREAEYQQMIRLMEAQRKEQR